MNNKAQSISLPTKLILGALIIVIIALIFILSSSLRITIIGIGFVIGSFVLIYGLYNSQRKIDNKSIALILIPLFIGGLLIALPYTGFLEQTTFASTFTPIYCNDYSFTCCSEKSSTTSVSNLADNQYYQCPSNANRCEITSASSNQGGAAQILTGKTNCKINSLLYVNWFGCDDEKKIIINSNTASYPIMFDKASYIFTGAASNNANLGIKIYTNQLIFTGRAGSTTGVPVSGADGCTFNPSNTYDGDGNLVKIDASGTSYTVHTGDCLLTWNKGDRHICGNLEEKCESDNDCIGHTYGNKECYGRTLQTYGCTQLNNIPLSLKQEAGNYIFYNSESSSGSFGTIVTSRCEIKSSTQVQCCGDTDCGTNSFCDTTAGFICKPKGTVDCTTDAQCGTSIVCDINTKQIKKPICKSNKCDYNIVSNIECCSSTDCAVGYFCGTDNKCKQSENPKTDCPYSCCINSINYLDKPCPNGKFCINGNCQASGCDTNADCSDGQICKNGNCVDDTKDNTKCEWYQESYSTTKQQCKILGMLWCEDKPYEGCKTSGLIYTIAILIFTGIMVITIVLLLKDKQKIIKRRYKK